MQWLGVLILFGILASLCIAGIYLARTQKTHNMNVATPLDNLYHSKGLGNVLDANQQLNLHSTREHQQTPRRQS
ncbi:MAG TPA: hypothetical protein VKV20_05045 [Ktedonobacteraceae bacterium]|jgi:hypothetical protein|nr:hypothetical protein [Ktedonobacteraceae bacterium]